MTGKIKITKEMLKKFVSEENVELPLEDIEALMDAEVGKPEDEMDTELIDLCSVILAKEYNPGYDESELPEMYRPWEEKERKPAAKRSVPFRRILLAAAVLVLVFAVALPVGAKLLGKNPGGIIGFYSDFFRISLSEDETTTSEATDGMSADDLDGYLLPEALLSEEYEKSVRIEKNDFSTMLYVELANEQEGYTGRVVITRYNNTYDMTNGQVDVPANTYRYIKQIQVKDKKVMVFSNGEISYINYIDGNSNYEIALTCDFDTMVSIAGTIKPEG